MTDIREIIDAFATAIITYVRGASEAAMQQVMRDAVGETPLRAAAPAATGKRMIVAGFAADPAPSRKSAKPQLCPVPGCKNRAAPVFGMVCAKHKGVPKSKIKQYREARRKKAAR